MSWEDAERSLAQLARRFALSDAQVQQLRLYAQVLANDSLAPTTLRTPQAILDDHLADALVALELPEFGRAGMIADIGAGAGVPGIPLAVALPAAKVVLLEANGRRCEFMRAVVSRLKLEDRVQVIQARAETWHGGHGICDVTTARAVAPLDVVAEYGAPLLRLDGIMVVWRGRRDVQAEQDAARAGGALGLTVAEVVSVAPYVGASQRHLHLFRKTAPTPSRFPRRDGVARKRPLGRI
ncbi:MAG: 16S rRNA (guanine(527)-N(7))-methyltransferase RsmG [Solirubrobacteraceae bacterium]